jgi:hypothetical protein
MRLKLITKAIEKKAQKQFPMGSDMNQMVVAKFFNPCGQGTWYLMNQDPNDTNYCWGIVKLFEVEVGSFGLDELKAFKGPFGIGIERDKFFTPRPAKEIYEALNRGEHI